MYHGQRVVPWANSRTKFEVKVFVFSGDRKKHRIFSICSKSVSILKFDVEVVEVFIKSSVAIRTGDFTAVLFAHYKYIVQYSPTLHK